MQYVKSNSGRKRGVDQLIKCSIHYQCLGLVAKRFEVTRQTVAALVEFYLLEDGYNISPRETQRPVRLFEDYVNKVDGYYTVNEKGFRIISALIFAINNRGELIRNRLKDQGKHIQ